VADCATAIANSFTAFANSFGVPTNSGVPMPQRKKCLSAAGAQTIAKLLVGKKRNFPAFYGCYAKIFVKYKNFVNTNY
jgi:hypothetical protein